MRGLRGASAAGTALAAVLVLGQLAGYAAAACRNWACTFNASSVQADCCDGKTCHPVLQQCYPTPRQLLQPCLDKDGYRCSPGLSCEPAFKRCYPSPRQEKQPCTKHSDCGSGLYCNDYTRRCQAPNAAKRKNCHASLPCGPGFTCDTIRNQCFEAPRVDDTPCVGREMSNPAVPNWGCAPGTTCETVISWECHPLPGLQQRCHATLPCQPGLSCHPHFQQCFNDPRQLGQPCGTVEEKGKQLTFGCDAKAGLICNTAIGRCTQPALERESCFAGRPCAAGLTCHPGLQYCLPSPRLEGQPCLDDGTAATKDFKCAGTTPIGEALTCDMLVSQKCIRAQLHAQLSTVAGAHCYPGRPCEQGLSCSTSDLKCYRSPRIANEPCVPGAPTNSTERCAPGLVCRPDTKRCDTPKYLNELCYPGFRCASGYSCVNAFRRCVRETQLNGEFCDPAAGPNECSTGLTCSADWPYCVLRSS